MHSEGEGEEINFRFSRINWEPGGSFTQQTDIHGFIIHVIIILNTNLRCVQTARGCHGKCMEIMKKKRNELNRNNCAEVK